MHDPEVALSLILHLKRRMTLKAEEDLKKLLTQVEKMGSKKDGK